MDDVAGKEQYKNQNHYHILPQVRARAGGSYTQQLEDLTTTKIKNNPSTQMLDRPQQRDLEMDTSRRKIILTGTGIVKHQR